MTSANSSLSLAVVVSKFNAEVTTGLLKGAMALLAEHGVKVPDANVYSAPGAFEIPLLARELARTGIYDGVICLGCVIKGDTAHFEYISLAASTGLMTATLETGVPLALGVLTTYTEQQAVVRSRDDAHNKGREAAAACLESITVLKKIRQKKVA